MAGSAAWDTKGELTRELRLHKGVVLFHVPFQDGEELPELALTLLRIRRVLDAILGMLVNHHLGEGFERLSCGDDLHEYIRTIAIVFDHLLDCGDLTSHLP